MPLENKISAGSYDLNRFLEGGYERDVITMIVGPAGSGKTNLAILATVSQAKKGKKVIFMDTEGGFSGERVKQLVNSDKEKLNYENVLENIFLLKPSSFSEQERDFLKLLKLIKEKQIDLIIVDGMTMLYRLELGEARNDEKKIKETNTSLAKQMKTLAEISRKMQIPVLVTNQVYGSFLSEEQFRKGAEREINFVGGDLMKYWSKCIIELKNDGGRRKAIIWKHRSLPEKELSFQILDSGIKKRGWI